MTMKGDEIFFEFDPFDLVGVKRPKKNVRAAKKEIAEFILDAVLDKVGEGNSPVSGYSSFPGLKPSYKKIKSEISSSVIPNLELTGDMLDSLEVVNGSGGKLKLRIKGSEALKADGHCHHSSKSKNSRLRQRTFIPNENKKETFKKDILQGVKEIISDYDDGN
jgi:hypothetical protein